VTITATNADGSVSHTTFSLTVTAGIATKTTLQTSDKSPVFGELVTFTATVAPKKGSGVPTGTVTFMDGSITLWTGTLSGGVASFSTSSLSVGNHHITAVYSGDSTYAGSTSTPVVENVKQDLTTTMLSSSLNPSHAGDPVTFTATVTANAPGSGTPSGTVTFKTKKAVLGTVTLDSSGHASLTISNLPVGQTTVYAVYNGDPSFKTSTGSIAQQVLAPLIPLPGSMAVGTVTTPPGAHTNIAIGGPSSSLNLAIGTPPTQPTVSVGTNQIGEVTLIPSDTSTDEQGDAVMAWLQRPYLDI
jgi:hypothetical protein